MPFSAGTASTRSLDEFIWSLLRSVRVLADINLAPTHAAMRDVQNHGIPRVQLWEPGVDTKRYSPHHRSERLRHHLAPHGELIVGYVGRLAIEKQVDLLAHTDQLPHVRTIIVGQGPDRDRLRSLLPHTHFTGRRQGTALARLYASFDLFVHTGGYETAGLTILEAQASGCPAIVPASGGAADMIQPNHTGLLFEPDNGTAIAETVTRLSTDRQLLHHLATNAHTTATTRNWQNATDQLLRHLQTAQTRTTHQA